MFEGCDVSRRTLTTVKRYLRRMDNPTPDQRRILRASPSTRRVIRVGSLWILLCLTFIGAAATLNALAPLGIVVHPAAAYQILTILIAVVSAPIGIYVFGYMTRSKSQWGRWALAAFGGALWFGFTLSALGWAVPVVTTLYAPNQHTQVMTITGTSDLAVSRLGCRHRAPIQE